MARKLCTGMGAVGRGPSENRVADAISCGPPHAVASRLRVCLDCSPPPMMVITFVVVA